MRLLTFSCVTLMAGAFLATAEQRPALPSGANLFIVPMEWDLDTYLRVEVVRTGLPVHLVAREQDADFVMTGSSVKLGSRLLAPGRDFQVNLVATASGAPVWSTQASDYATFFARLRSHGSGRAARSIVQKMRNRFFRPGR